jgi:hypothetical protein
MADAAMLMVTGRIIEKLLIASGGLLCMWLGYKLFFLTASATVKSLEVEGRGIKLRAEIVAPGIFFAAFGATLLGYSAYTKIDVSVPNREESSQGSTASTEQGSTHIFGAEDSRELVVPNHVRAVNTLLAIRKTQVDSKSTELSAGDYASFSHSVPYLTEIQRQYIDRKYNERGLYDRVREIKEYCDANNDECNKYRANPEQKRLMDEVLRDLNSRF